MRIGLVAPPWVSVPPVRYGGTEGVVDTLARGFVASGHEVVLFTTGDASCPVPRRWVYETPPEPLGTTVEEFRHVQAAYEALANCDVVHDHTVAGPVWAATRRRRPPVVVTNHGPFTPGLRAFYREVAQWTAVTAISFNQRASAPDVPIRAVIHHGIEPSRFEVGRGDGGYALFLGRFAPEKGAHRAIEIARRAGMPLRIAAKMREPSEVQYFQHWVEPALGGDVEYLGEVGPAERDGLLGGACALLNPIAWREPFGLVMIESMACGTPVVAYPYGAAPEIVEPGVTGFLCDNPREAVVALGNIDRLDRRACRAAVEGHFSAQRMVGEYLALYDQVTVPATHGRAGVHRSPSLAPIRLDEVARRTLVANG